MPTFDVNFIYFEGSVGQNSKPLFVEPVQHIILIPLDTWVRFTYTSIFKLITNIFIFKYPSYCNYQTMQCLHFSNYLNESNMSYPQPYSAKVWNSPQ